MINIVSKAKLSIVGAAVIIVSAVLLFAPRASAAQVSIGSISNNKGSASFSMCKTYNGSSTVTFKFTVNSSELESSRNHFASTVYLNTVIGATGAQPTSSTYSISKTSTAISKTVARGSVAVLKADHVPAIGSKTTTTTLQPYSQYRYKSTNVYQIAPAKLPNCN